MSEPANAYEDGSLVRFGPEELSKTDLATKLSLLMDSTATNHIRAAAQAITISSK
ncbi:hypothetical protein PM082_015517 [Marasmius tenuissimus]|nr:hypothetical protein PM082_015517 [Marasmius tenuissimus]